ncbi:unnamed protein product [Caenorhabditis brenneri]
MFSVKLKKAGQSCFRVVLRCPTRLWESNEHTNLNFILIDPPSMLHRLSVKWERRIGEIQKRIEPIAENPPSTPGTIPQSVPLPALAQVLNPML